MQDINKELIKPGGKFFVSVIRNGKVIHKDPIGSINKVVDEGLNHMLATEFAQGTPISTWYIGIYTNTITPLATDTAAGVVARAGETSAYDEANRPEYVEVANTPNVKMSNTVSPATFTINSGIIARGAFLISSSGKASATGTLMALANFASARSLVAADQLVVTYEIAATSAS